MISHSPNETKKIAAELAGTLAGGEVILLSGELGAGKTVFVQGLAEALGVQESVRSPTFTIMQVYSFPPLAKGGRGGVLRQIVHLDFYRTASSQGLGLEEYLGQPDILVVIEWPPADLDVRRARTIHISLKIRGENERDIILHRPRAALLPQK